MSRNIADQTKVAPARTQPDFSGELAAGSSTLASWTIFTRLTGFARVGVIAAVLGPTFFGNLFQVAILVPYLLCELMAGSLITTMLPPHLVRSLEKGDRASSARLARGILGVILPLYAVAAVLVIALAPVVLSLLTLAVDDPSIRSKQIALGVPLLICLVPQIFFYAISAVAISVQHAHRRFALPTAAPAIENVGLILVLAANAFIFGIGLSIDEVTVSQLMVLGLGSTAAVGAHAAVQWWGAYRLGVPLLPIAGWRSPAVRRIIQTAIPSCGSATLNSISWFALLTASGVIPGGVIAFQIGISLYNLPMALSVSPVAYAQSPLLSQFFARADYNSFTATYRHSLRLALFFALPACAMFLGMPYVIAAAVSFGEMANTPAIALVAAILSGLGIGLVGEAIFVVARSSAYARLDALLTLRAMLIRIAIILIGIPIALEADTAEFKMWYLGLTYSAAAVVAAAYMHWRGRSELPYVSDDFAKWLIINGAVAALAVIPATLIVQGLSIEPGAVYERIVEAMALLSISGILYFLIQYFRCSPEFQILLGYVRSRWPTISLRARERNI